MKPLINITRLKGVETQLTRIADCFETYLRLKFNYNMTAPKPFSVSDLEESLDYADDEKTAVGEVKDLLSPRPEEE